MIATVVVTTTVTSLLYLQYPCHSVNDLLGTKSDKCKMIFLNVILALSCKKKKEVYEKLKEGQKYSIPISQVPITTNLTHTCTILITLPLRLP